MAFFLRFNINVLKYIVNNLAKSGDDIKMLAPLNALYIILEMAEKK